MLINSNEIAHHRAANHVPIIMTIVTLTYTHEDERKESDESWTY